MNEVIYFTITALLLYVAADKILLTAERLRGGHFKNRSMIFFAIILALALGSFQILQHLLPKKEVEAEATTQTQEATAPSPAQEIELPAEEPRVSNPPKVE